MSRRLVASAVLAAWLCAVPLMAILPGFAAGVPLVAQRLMPYRTCTLTAAVSSTPYVTDATVKQGSPTSNAGSATTIVVASSNGANQRVYVWFDLTLCAPVIPSSASVRSAALRLFATGLAGACRTIDVFRVTAAWTETGVTWNNEPFGAAINNPASGARTDSFNAGTPAGCENLTANTYVTGADVTTDVAAFVAGSATNAGWMLRDDVEGSATARTTTFASKEAAVVARAPQLVIGWVAVP